jgi:hypothetical protein
MEWLLLLWPATGIACAYFSTPQWMFDHDPAMYVGMAILGAICGPFGAFWFLDRSE